MLLPINADCNRKHHAQLIVSYGRWAKFLFDCRRERPFAFKLACQFRSKSPGCSLASQDIDCTVLSRRHEPRGWVLRYASELPDLKCPAEGFLHHVFCQAEIVNSEYARQRGDHSDRFMSE